MENVNMIFGAPGCGKTTRLMSVLEELLSVYPSEEIAFVSFTKKGSYEGRDRAMEKFGLKEKQFPYFRTIHSIAFRELEMSKYDMISRKHYKDFSNAMGMNFVGYYTEDFINNDDKYLFYESLRLNNPRMADQMALDLDHNIVRRVHANYGRFKDHVGVKDFDDLIVEFIDKDITLPVRVAIIDEAQDLTSLQWKFCEVAFKDCEKIYIAGDDDQAIYEWSGADVQHFLSLTKSSKIEILDKSYRLRSNILDFSKGISKRIENRVDKEFAPVEDGGNIYYYNDLSELRLNSEESYYFLSRNNYFLRYYKELLTKYGTPFWYKEEFSVDKKLVDAIRRYEKYRQASDVPAFMKDLTLKGFLKEGTSTLVRPWFDVFNIDLSMANYYRDLFKNRADFDKSNLKINTIHGVKGGEADNVVLMLDVTKSVVKALGTNSDPELRCLYVALTRAKRNLHIVFSGSRFGYDDIIKEVI